MPSVLNTDGEAVGWTKNRSFIKLQSNLNDILFPSQYITASQSETKTHQGASTTDTHLKREDSHGNMAAIPMANFHWIYQNTS